MKFSTAVLSFLTILPPVVTAGVVRVRFEEDGADVKVSVRGRFDASSCTPIVSAPLEDAIPDTVGFAAFGTAFGWTTDEPELSQFLACDAVSVVCPLMAESSPVLSGGGGSFPLTDINGLQSVVFFLDTSLLLGLTGVVFGDFALQLGTDYEPGDLLSGEATVAGESLATMSLDTFSGEVCTIKLSDPSLFKTDQRIEVHVGTCTILCSIYWAIYDFLGFVFGFTYSI